MESSKQHNYFNKTANSNSKRRTEKLIIEKGNTKKGARGGIK